MAAKLNIRTALIVKVAIVGSVVIVIFCIKMLSLNSATEASEASETTAEAGSWDVLRFRSQLV